TIGTLVCFWSECNHASMVALAGETQRLQSDRPAPEFRRPLAMNSVKPSRMRNSILAAVEARGVGGVGVHDDPEAVVAGGVGGEVVPRVAGQVGGVLDRVCGAGHPGEDDGV